MMEEKFLTEKEVDRVYGLNLAMWQPNVHVCKCGRKYIPTPQSYKKCLFCKRHKQYDRANTRTKGQLFKGQKGQIYQGHEESGGGNRHDLSTVLEDYGVWDSACSEYITR